MAHRAKFIIRIAGFTSKPEMPDSSFRLAVEWKRIDGDRRGGKHMVAVIECQGNSHMKEEVLDQMAAELSAQYAPERIAPRDIIGPM